MPAKDLRLPDVDAEPLFWQAIPLRPPPWPQALLATRKLLAGRRLATKRSPLPNGIVASINKHATSTSPIDAVAAALVRSPSKVRGFNTPGVSTKTTWASAKSSGDCKVSTPRTWVRVVCTLSDTIDTLVPQIRLTRVDFPTLGRPTIEQNPERIGERAYQRSGVSGVEVSIVVVGVRHTGDADPSNSAAFDPFGSQQKPFVLNLFTL